MTSTDEVTTRLPTHGGHYIPETHEQAIRRLLAQTNERLAELTEAVKVLAAAKWNEADGWIPHDGGPCPVAKNAWVWVQPRVGHQRGRYAYSLVWEHRGGDDDIIAWRRA